MLDEAVGAPPKELVTDPVHGWRAGLDAWTRGMYGRAMAHPWITRLEVSGAPNSPNQLAWMDRGVAPLAGAPLTGQEKLSAILMLSRYAMSAAQLTSDITAAASAGTFGPDDVDYAAILTRDPERFPALYALAVPGEIDPPAPPEGYADELHNEFHFGLARMLDGLDVLLRSRASR